MRIGPRTGNAGEFIYSVEAKRRGFEDVDYRVPPDVGAAVLREIERSALRAYRALGCRDVGRVDIRLDARLRPYVLEINPLPGLSPTASDLPTLASHAGVPYSRLIRRIVEEAVRRRASR
jgi:D-alanine-D-alanine ligase